ncbi:MAG: hypothetical protein M5R42_09260 [Rhodocyclaceae bacterium]|nr:hypothetical protein [Rhodocyclaceae bacterium]
MLLKRTRWLIASLVLLFALATPGVYILPALGGYGPTAEGMWLGLEHLMRLLFVLATLSVLLQLTGGGRAGGRFARGDTASVLAGVGSRTFVRAADAL